MPKVADSNALGLEPEEGEDVLGEDVRRALERVRDARMWKNLHWRPGGK